MGVSEGKVAITVQVQEIDIEALGAARPRAGLRLSARTPTAARRCARPVGRTHHP